MKTLTFEKNQEIFKEGAFGETMYDIVSGRVGVYSKYGTTKQTLVAELGANDIFGEMGMIEVYPRSATVIALEDNTQVTEITESELSEYFKDKPEKVLGLLKTLSKRIRETNDKYINVCKTVYERDEAENNGTPCSAQVNEEIDTLRRDYSMYNTAAL